MKQKHESCPYCGNRTFTYDVMGVVDKGEKPQQKVAVICGNKSSCNKIIEFLEYE